MILKSADNKDQQIAELERLFSVAPADRKVKIEQELRAVRSGLKAEKDAAYEIIENIGKQLVAFHEPATFDFAAKFGIAEVGVQPKQAREPEVAYVAPPLTSANEQPKCRSCGSDKLSVQYGKYGYYFKCSACDGNTPIKVDCGKQGHKERIRKEGLKFFRTCAQCGTSGLYFTNLT